MKIILIFLALLISIIACGRFLNSEKDGFSLFELFFMIGVSTVCLIVGIA